jgi:serine/threonine protein kinase/formylglycine-generating enzyme required for sulfatase activity
MSALFQLVPGAVFAEEFRIVRALSEGGMGAVYVAEQLSTGKQRALKVMHPQLVHDPAMRARFVQEARIGSKIDSDHVVDVLDAGIDAVSSIPWLVMELLQGETLQERVDTRGPRPREEVAEILGQLCHAVGAAHDVGVVHRDLKPENVFLAVPRREGVPFIVKVLDFGIAKLVADAGNRERTTGAVGSPLWMAPEQASALGEIAPATDVWALGLIAFWLLTGKEFWKAAHTDEINPMALIVEALTEKPPAASVRAKELGVGALIPAGFDGWFAQCVCHDTGSRFKNARAARGPLERLLLGREPLEGPKARVPDIAVPDLDLAPPVAKPPAEKKQAEPAKPKPEPRAEPAPKPPPSASSSGPHSAPRRSGGGLELAAHAGPAGQMSGMQGSQPRHRIARAMSAGDERAPDRPFPWKGVAIGGVLLVAALIGAQKFFWTRSESTKGASGVASGAPGAEIAPPSAKPAPTACPAGMAYFAGGRAEETRVEPFCLEVSEATVDDYAACVKAKKCTAAHAQGNWPTTNGGQAVRNTACNAARDGHGTHPINCVDWPQAVAFCAWKGGKKLPTDAQWEWAARRGEARTKFPWGAEAPDVHLCFSGMQKRSETCKVGSFPKGDAPGGVHDLAGNVSEWTSTEASDKERVYCGADFTDGAGGEPLYSLGYCSRAQKTQQSAMLGVRCATAP